MNSKKYLGFEINLTKSAREAKFWDIQVSNYQILFKSVMKLCSHAVLSWRYVYSQSAHQLPKLYLRINTSSSEACDNIISLITKGNLSRFYNFRLIDIDKEAYSIDEINSISEVIKDAEFINSPGLTGYLPHSFETHLQDNDFSFLRDPLALF